MIRGGSHRRFRSLIVVSITNNVCIGSTVARSVAMNERERVADAHHFVASTIDIRKPVQPGAPYRQSANGNFDMSVVATGQNGVRDHLRRKTERSWYDDYGVSVNSSHETGCRVIATHLAAVNVEQVTVTR